MVVYIRVVPINLDISIKVLMAFIVFEVREA